MCESFITDGSDQDTSQLDRCHLSTLVPLSCLHVVFFLYHFLVLTVGNKPYHFNYFISLDAKDIAEKINPWLTV